MVLGLTQQRLVEFGRLANLDAEFVDLLELVEEPRVDLGRLEQLLEGGTESECLLDPVHPTVLRYGQVLQQRVQTFCLDLGAGPVARALGFERAHHLAEGLGEVAADGHRLADGLHRRGQCAVGTGELLERESRCLDHHVVQRRLEAGRRLLGDVVDDLVEGVPDGQLGGHLGDRVARGLGRQSRRA